MPESGAQPRLSIADIASKYDGRAKVPARSHARIRERPTGERWSMFFLALWRRIGDMFAARRRRAAALGSSLSAVVLIGFLVLLRRAGERSLPYVQESLIAIATAYTFLSFVPWMSRLISLLMA